MDIFSKDDLEMYAPEDILYEFRKYSEELKSKSEEFEETVFCVFSFIRIIPKEDYVDTMEKAQNICTKFDEKDSPFIGLALKLNIPIWTNDKGILKNEGEYQTITTTELKKLLK